MAPESAESLVECVKKLVDNPELCKQLGANAYRNIALVHNRDKQAEDYIKVLEEFKSC